MTSRRRAASTVSVIGELLITVGVILGLFVAYSLWWTNVLADDEANDQADRVRESWSRTAPAEEPTDEPAEEPAEKPGALNTEDGIGFLHVPAMISDEILVKKGTSKGVLDGGVAGYYTGPPESALPQDEKGNFTLAAHRDGHGAKFHNIHQLKKGDPIVFESRSTWYVYKVYKILPHTSPYNVDVLDPIPKDSGKTTAGRYITLTTCTPMYTSEYRYIVWGELVRTEKADADRTPPKELRR